MSGVAREQPSEWTVVPALWRPREARRSGDLALLGRGEMFTYIARRPFCDPGTYRPPGHQ